jgi:hypothetical protein
VIFSTATRIEEVAEKFAVALDESWWLLGPDERDRYRKLARVVVDDFGYDSLSDVGKPEYDRGWNDAMREAESEINSVRLRYR